MSLHYRVYGQRPSWCLDEHPEPIIFENGDGSEYVTWTRYFAPPGVTWNVALCAEDQIGPDGVEARTTVLRVFEGDDDLPIDEALLLAKCILDAVVAWGDEA